MSTFRPLGRGSGFTVVELLIVMAIIGVAMALLFPAMQKAREAASQVRCAHQLRQVGLAAHSYHACHEQLPPGYLGPVPRGEIPDNKEGFQHVGVQAFLLPYLHADSAFTAIRINLSIDEPQTRAGDRSLFWWNDLSTRTIARTTLPQLICPSDDPYEASDRVMIALWSHNGQPKSPVEMMTSIVAPSNGGISMLYRDAPQGAAALGRTNYMGNMGMLGITGQQSDRFTGPLYNRSQVAFSQWRDGTSTTLLFGESWGGSRTSSETYTASWMGVGALPTYQGLRRFPDYYEFSSAHPGGVQFCFGDGSVHVLSREIDAENVFIPLSGYKDGVQIPISEVQ